MRPGPRPFANVPLVASLLAVALLSILNACIADRIRVVATEGIPLAGASTVYVSLAKALDGSRPTTPPTPGDALLIEARSRLVEKGYAIGASAVSSDAALELEVRTERVSRRTYSADTDANGIRLVERTEAIVSLRVVERGLPVWRCEARGRLPEPELAALESTGDLLAKLLDRALAKVPKHG